jgi:hypothetical protein
MSGGLCGFVGQEDGASEFTAAAGAFAMDTPVSDFLPKGLKLPASLRPRPVHDARPATSVRLSVLHEMTPALPGRGLLRVFQVRRSGEIRQTVRGDSAVPPGRAQCRYFAGFHPLQDGIGRHRKSTRHLAGREQFLGHQATSPSNYGFQLFYRIYGFLNRISSDIWPNPGELNFQSIFGS